MLTPGQIEHFRTFGFLILRGCYNQREVAEIQQLHADVLEQDRGGRPFDPTRRHLVLGFMESRPELVRLLEDDRLYVPLEQLLGPDYIWTGSDGNLYTGETPWHPDSDEHLLAIGYHRIKVALYLDPLTATTGALRIIPSSHRAPLYQELSAARQQPGGIAERFGVPESAVPAAALESVPGDVVMFDTHAWHASFGGRPGRRMIALSYAQAPTRPEHDRFLKEVYDFNIRCIKEMGYSDRDWMYGEPFLRSERPRIRRMSEHLVELGLR
jgi:hypothetical protein